MPKVLESQAFRFQELPLELRNQIYHFALVEPQKSFSPYHGQGPQHILRYRYNHPSRLLKTTSNSGDKTRDWFADFYFSEGAEAVNWKQFSFGLARTSTWISKEALKVFYEETHFAFESLFDLYQFLSRIGANANYIRSLSVRLMESRLGNKKDALPSLRSWSKGLTLARFVQQLEKTCQGLRYLELLPYWNKLRSADRRKYDQLDLQNWDFVTSLCMLRIKKIHFLTSADCMDHRIVPNRVQWWEKDDRKWCQVEDHVRQELHNRCQNVVAFPI